MPERGWKAISLREGTYSMLQDRLQREGDQVETWDTLLNRYLIDSQSNTTPLDSQPKFVQASDMLTTEDREDLRKLEERLRKLYNTKSFRPIHARQAEALRKILTVPAAP